MNWINWIAKKVSTGADSESRDRLRIIASTRSAQRGPQVWTKLLLSMLEGEFLGKNDLVSICDLHSHAGDLSLALCQMRSASLLPCKLQHLLVQCPGKNGIENEYAMKRTVSDSLMFVLCFFPVLLSLNKNIQMICLPGRSSFVQQSGWERQCNSTLQQVLKASSNPFSLRVLTLCLKMKSRAWKQYQVCTKHIWACTSSHLKSWCLSL